MNRQNILILDASPLIYATFNSVGHFCTKAGEPTGLRFGFIRSLRSYAEKTNADKVIVCYDTPAPVKKAEGVETYKATRTWTAEKQTMYDQIPALKEMLALTRYTQVETPGYEADDIVGHLANRLSDQGHNIYIVTTDNDLCQLVSHERRIKLWMPPKGKEKAWFKDHDWIKNEFGVEKGLLNWRALEGDTSDNIPGAWEIKPTKPARTRLAQTHDGMTQSQRDNPQEYLRIMKTAAQSADSFAEINEERFLANRNLMTLHSPPELTITKGAKKTAELRELFERLEMKSLVDKTGQFTGEQA
jgi:DNA polymerase I